MLICVIFLLSAASSLSPASWIGDSLLVIGEKPLKNLTLPGTHDSGSYNLTESPMPGDSANLTEALYKLAVALNTSVGNVTIAWSNTQDQSFYQQMLGGIRYFDLRAGWDNRTNHWVTYHFVTGTPVEYLLQNISQYLGDYTKEIVIVEMSHFEGFPSAANIDALKKMVMGILGASLYPVDLSFNFTVNSIVSSGKRAIVTMEQGYDGINIWPPSSIYNTYANSPNLEEMINFNNATIQRYMNGTWPGQLFKVSWTLTANNTTVEEAILPSKPHTLIQLADVANSALPSFWIKINRNNWKMGNILIVDHYESSSILKVIWESNGISENHYMGIDN